LENDLSDLTFEKIGRELELLNINMAEANDIAILSAYSPIPATLDDDGRKALRRLRDRIMERVISRAGS
jgi:hypothetical protein